MLISPLPDWAGPSAARALPRLVRALKEVARAESARLIVFGPGLTSLLLTMLLSLERPTTRNARRTILIRTSIQDALPAMVPQIARPATRLCARAVQAVHARLQRSVFASRAFVSKSLAGQWNDPSGSICPEIDWAALRRLESTKSWPSERESVVFLGRLSREKGVDLAVGGYLRAGDLPLPLLVVGDGPEMARLRAQVADSHSPCARRVHFLGRMDHDDALSLLAAASVTLVPSRAEAFGLVAFEALAAGSRVLHSGVGGLVEATDGHPAAEVVNPNDVDAWAEAIRSAVTVRHPPADGLHPSRVTSLERRREELGWTTLLELVAEPGEK